MSPNDWNNSSDGADGWVDPNERRPRPVDLAEPRAPDVDLSEPEHFPLERAANAPPETDSEVSRAKAMAVFAHLSILFGLPVFVVPMIQRDNAFALHHAKAAATIFGVFALCLVVSLLTCGLAVPAAFLCYVPALVGIVKASHGEEAGRWGFGDLGERIFSGLEVKTDTD